MCPAFIAGWKLVGIALDPVDKDSMTLRAMIIACLFYQRGYPLPFAKLPVIGNEAERDRKKAYQSPELGHSCYAGCLDVICTR